MNQILLVAKREFITQAKNKTFIIMTVLSPIFLVGIIGIIAWMISANSDQKSIAVVDESQEFITTLVSGENEIYNFYSAKDIKGIKDTLLNSKTLNGLLVIPKFDQNNLEPLENGIELTTNGNIGMGFKEKLEDRLNKRLEELKMQKAGISDQQLKTIDSNLQLKTFNLKGGEEDKGEFLKFGLAMFLSYVIFMFIMIYGVKVMRSVVEEKNNRVVEIIISSVKPFNLMMGKILGTTFVALTQFIIWILMGLGLTFAASAFLSSKMEIPTNLSTPQAQEMMAQNPEWMNDAKQITDTLMELNYPFILTFFVLFFFVGYLFYSSIFAAIGSAVDNDTDTQQFTFYPIFPMMIAMYGSFTAMENPDGPVSFWLSMIPLTSPISMVTRLPFGVEWWEIALSLTLLIGSMLLMVYFASKIYRVGILMYGKKPSLKEMWKWMRYSN
ncbi:ABC transporter permease [Moheibacter lacus]|uniref:ABC transporter permease n=1 Tax=Moheibacter lacus TaxID=2745851 RepID=A0A838ZSQ9_9FLAO|nr:ABC transporter permease [Moheibacter lacus]MBA5630010.1 ABC transporter permease [Moheibacter lacus]